MTQYMIIEVNTGRALRHFMERAAADLHCRRMNRASGFLQYRVEPTVL